MASSLKYGLADETDLEDLRIVADRKLSMVVVTTASSEDQVFAIVDHEDEKLDVVIVTEGDVRLLSKRIGMQPNREQVHSIEVDERAAFVVFYSGHEELERVPIQRLAGEETRVVWP